MSIYNNIINNIPWNLDTIEMINCCASITINFICYLDTKIFKTAIYTRMKNQITLKINFNNERFVLNRE